MFTSEQKKVDVQGCDESVLTTFVASARNKSLYASFHLISVLFSDLDLSHNKISSVTNSTFSGLTSLKALNLGYNQLTTLLNDSFHQLTEVQNVPFFSSSKKDK